MYVLYLCHSLNDTVVCDFFFSFFNYFCLCLLSIVPSFLIFLCTFLNIYYNFVKLM